MITLLTPVLSSRLPQVHAGSLVGEKRKHKPQLIIKHKILPEFTLRTDAGIDWKPDKSSTIKALTNHAKIYCDWPSPRYQTAKISSSGPQGLPPSLHP